MRSRSTDFASCSIGFYTNTTHFLIVVSTRSNTRLSMCTWQGKEGWRSNECLEWLKLTLSSQIYTTKLYIYVCVCMMYVCCVCMHARVYIYICIYIHTHTIYTYILSTCIHVLSLNRRWGKCTFLSCTLGVRTLSNHDIVLLMLLLFLDKDGS